MQITLTRVAPAVLASFGIPFAPGALTRTGQLSVGNRPIAVTPTLWWYDAGGRPTSIKAVRVQLPMPEDVLVLEVTTEGLGPDWPLADGPFADVSHAVTHTVTVADYTIEKSATGVYSIPPSNVRELALFTSREPCVVAEFPAGYLAASGLFGPLRSRAEVVADPALAGVRYLSDYFVPATTSALYLDTYPAHAASVTLPMPVEGFLYDRAATVLLAYAHTDDLKFRRPAYRYAQSYLSGIVLEGTVGGPGVGLRGYWNGKGSWDSKYSHARGIFYYYALTGDEGALAALKAIGEMWAGDLYFSKPYQDGKIRNWDKLWTERLLGTALEGTIYGFLATGDRSHLDAFERLLQTAYRHISTQDQAELDAIMQPWTETLADGTKVTHRFPPQNAWVHNGAQSADAGPREPWCSGWMIELVLDPLLAFQAMTNDPRVDDIFIRLGRFLRDTGTCYFGQTTVLGTDTFLAPSVAYDPALPASRRRRVIPMYGSGRKMDGTRWNNVEYSDYEHVPDATGMTAAAWRGLVRQQIVGDPLGPFASEQACAEALHQEYSASAVQSLIVRDGTIYRDPTLPPNTFHAQGRLALIANDPAAYAAWVSKFGLGYPRWGISPERKLSWWFNSSILQYGLLKDAGLAVPTLICGWVQPDGSIPPPPPPPNQPPVIDVGGPYTVQAGAPLALTAIVKDPDDQDVSVIWDLGDGAIWQGPTLTHTYAQAGTYTITAQARDPHGAIGTDMTEATVTVPPPTYAELVAENAALEAEVAALDAELVATQAEILAFHTKITAAVAILEG
jgi:hypothetical protein